MQWLYWIVDSEREPIKPLAVVSSFFIFHQTTTITKNENGRYLDFHWPYQQTESTSIISRSKAIYLEHQQLLKRPVKWKFACSLLPIAVKNATTTSIFCTDERATSRAPIQLLKPAIKSQQRDQLINHKAAKSRYAHFEIMRERDTIKPLAKQELKEAFQSLSISTKSKETHQQNKAAYNSQLARLRLTTPLQFV